MEVRQSCAFRHAVSVFFPAYNDAKALPALLETTFATLRAHVSEYEVIVVNDGSGDETAQVLEQLREVYAPFLRVITHEVNRGYGGALRSGLEAAEHEFVFYTDGDGQYDPGEMVKLLQSMAPDVGLVNGYKVRRQDPWHRIAIGLTYNKCARFLFRIRIRDIDCDFRLIRRALLSRLDLNSRSGAVCVELVRKIELVSPRVAEVPVNHYPRLHGRSQFFRLQSLANTFLELCRLYYGLVLTPAFLSPVNRLLERWAATREK
jgi:glycosyltransferase involved in cell wall biosynthesis